MTAYLPNDFWTVAFWHTEGTAIPKVALRSLVFAIPALIAALMAEHQSKFRKVFGESSVLADQSVDQVPSGLITPFALLVALLTSHRLNSAHVALSYGVIPLSIASNVIYFTVDHCASQMEAPFGDDLMDVDVHKMLRRIDKNTASLLSLYTKQPVLNYNLFPETRKTGQDGARLKWRKAQHSLGNVYKMDAKRRESAAEKREKFRNDRLSLVSKTKLRCASSAKKLTETLGLAWLEALHATRIQARVRGNASRRARSARWMQPHSSPAGIV